MDEKETDERQEDFGHPGRRGGGGRILTGLFLVGIGGVLLMEQLGVPLPDWLFSWHTLLIAIGIFLGFKHGFRGPGWLILIVVGGVFLLEDTFPQMPVHRFSWPFALIVIGLVVIARPGKFHHRRQWRWEEYAQRKNTAFGSGQSTYSSEDFVDSTTIFGGVHKKIVSKNFRGGDVTSLMGGTELNLSQADINGIVVIDITQIMGGTKLIVPPHWEIRSEVSAVFAGYEDKRQQVAITNPDKILVLKGTSIFGGIEVRNY